MEEGEGSDWQDKLEEALTRVPRKENMDPKPNPTEPQGPQGMDLENKDMDLGELDLDGIEKECDNLSKGYIPFEQIALLEETIVKMKGV